MPFARFWETLPSRSEFFVEWVSPIAGDAPTRPRPFRRDFIRSSCEKVGIPLMKIDRARLPRQARYWTLHCGINALPSFIVAAFYLQMISQPACVIAMLLAILTFIAAYTVVTSLEGWFSDSQSVLSRALKAGVRIRLVLSLVSLPMLLPTPVALFVPDVWAGILASSVVNAFGRMTGFGDALIAPDAGSVRAPAVYATTIIEGLILSFMLMMLSFFSLLVIQARERKKIGRGIPTPPTEAR
jgi:hypothetical protein